jgi:hypothetical protein
MSTDLARSATHAADPGFRDLLRAAIVEHAIDVVGIITDTGRTLAQELAARILYDPDVVLGAFVRAAANAAAISAADDPDPDDLRRVTADCWDRVASVIPNLGD